LILEVMVSNPLEIAYVMYGRHEPLTPMAVRANSFVVSVTMMYLKDPAVADGVNVGGLHAGVVY
jgi:hypothetical protein